MVVALVKLSFGLLSIGQWDLLSFYEGARPEVLEVLRHLHVSNHWAFQEKLLLDFLLVDCRTRVDGALVKHVTLGDLGNWLALGSGLALEAS